MIIKKTNILLKIKDVPLFTVPKYQRKYDWNVDNCKRLLEDMQATIIEKDGKLFNKKHFFGSMVLLPDENENTYIVVDGQQRITTIIIIALALRDLFSEGKISFENERLADVLNEIILSQGCEGNKCKIKLSGDDSKIMDDIINGNLRRESNHTSNIFDNYHVMRSELQSNDYGDDIVKAIENLEIVDIQLDENDDPQAIFDSLNSTGSALSQVDQIRNYLLMKMPTSKLQDDCYDEYWVVMENLLSNNFEQFLCDYLSFKSTKQVKSSKVYRSFRTFFEKESPKTEDSVLEILDELKKFSEIYYQILKARTGIGKIDDALVRLNIVGAQNAYAFFMRIFEMLYNNKLSEIEVVEILEIIESYNFRKFIVTGTGVKKDVMLSLDRYIEEQDNADKYIEKLKYILLNKQGDQKFPDDTKFIEHLKMADMYRTQYCQYALGKFEIYNNNKWLNFKSLYDFINENDYTIEHIMPQDAMQDNGWIITFGRAKAKIVYDTWVNKLANLTFLTRKDNSELGKRGFSDKIQCYQKSNFALNEYISSQYKEWSEESLKERQKHLMDQAIKIWPNIQTEYQGSTLGDYREITLNASDDMIRFVQNRKIESFKIKKDSKPKKLYGDDTSWTRFYVEAVKEILKTDVDRAYELMKIQDYSDIFYSRQEKTNYKLIDEGLFISRPTSAKAVIEKLRRITDAYKLDKYDFKIKFEDEGYKLLK